MQHKNNLPILFRFYILAHRLSPLSLSRVARMSLFYVRLALAAASPSLLRGKSVY